MLNTPFTCKKAGIYEVQGVKGSIKANDYSDQPNY